MILGKEKEGFLKLVYSIGILLALFVVTFFLVSTFVYGQSFKTSILWTFILALISFFSSVLILSSSLNRLVTERNKMRQVLTDNDSGSKLLIRRDLELTRAMEKLRELDVAKSSFISVVAHQLRTPLSGIKWTLNMIMSGELGVVTSEQKTFLLKSYESNNRMITLVNDMLDADRIQSGKLQHDTNPIDVINLLDNVLFEVSPNAYKKNVSIQFKDKLEPVPAVKIDSEKMRAVIQNLLENAIKYTPKNGGIQIGLKHKENEVEVSISDTGIGIPKEEQKNVFNRFFRAKNAVRAETDGSGLGLFISKGIVEQHGGKIWFESEENKGTTFYFTIPLEKKA